MPARDVNEYQWKNSWFEDAVKEANDLFDTVLSISNQAVAAVDFNNPFAVNDHLTVTVWIDVVDYKYPEWLQSVTIYEQDEMAGPYQSSVSYDDGFGKPLPLELYPFRNRKLGFDPNATRLYSRIVVSDNGKPVHVMAEYDGYRIMFNKKGPWLEEIRAFLSGHNQKELIKPEGIEFMNRVSGILSHLELIDLRYHATREMKEKVSCKL